MKYLYKHFVFVLVLVWAFSFSAKAQQLHFERPTVLSDTLNSNAEESYPLYSSRDSTLFFVRTLSKENTGGFASGQDIWYSKRDNSGRWSIPKNDLKTLNNRENNAVVGIADTGSTLYVMNAYDEKEQSEPGLAFSSAPDGNWSAPKQIKIPTLEEKQGNYYSLFVAPTEDIAIISMQNEKSLGLEDLYVSLKDTESNQWSAPIHLGPTINTSGFEISPYLSKDKKSLFFSSNGHPGYGNADIFVSTRLDSTWTRWSKPKNLGDEINSVAFDAYLTINEENEVFFVSNRTGGPADIFYSKIISEEDRASELASRIESRGDYSLSDLNNADSDPETQSLIEETQRLLEEFKKGQPRSSEGKNNEGTNNKESKTFSSKTVYFDLNSYNIRTAATSELDQVVNTLQESPRLNIRIIGHADDTGGKDYNLKLSIDRAQTVKKYLVDAGIDASRIITFGKGATQPATSNASDEGKSQNRRVEIEFFTF